MALHDALREKALANFDALLELWQLNYKKVTPNEYDILATWRTDRNYGSCRFNIEKGKGADFAGNTLTNSDFSKLGIGFTNDDFIGFSSEGQSKIAFDIIGFCQRIYKCNSYQDGIKHLDDDIKTLSRRDGFIHPSYDAAERRAAELRRKQKLRLDYARDLWESAKYHTYEGSAGEAYLRKRKIDIKDKNIRVHKGINYIPLKQTFPALIFKVQHSPESELCAVHRIFLTHSGEKAKIDNPKMALASIKGAGIWLGEPFKTLHIAEGPENALTLRVLGAKFVISSIYSTNFHNLKIPDYVKRIVLCPDADDAGTASYLRAIEAYKKYLDLGVIIQDYLIEKILLQNGKFADLNDLLMAGT